MSQGNDSNQFGEVLTRQDVAKILKCTTRTVINMEDDGRLIRPFYIGNRTPRWLKKDIDKWVADLAEKAKQPKPDGT